MLASFALPAMPEDAHFTRQWFTVIQLGIKRQRKGRLHPYR